MAVTVKPVIESVAVPVFVSVKAWVAEVVFTSCPPKDVNPVGEKEATGATPVPDRPTVCGLPPRASSAIVKFAERLPVTVGVKVTFILQDPPAASAVPHVLLSAKSPPALIEVRLRVASPLLVNVTV